MRKLLAAVACLVSAAAVAADAPRPFYVGAGAGVSFHDADFGAQVRNAYDGTPFTIAAADLTDDDDRAYRIFGGWRFAQHAAAELAYVDLGRVRGHYTVVDATLHSNFRDTRHRVSGPQLSLVGLLPVGDRFTLHGKLGVVAARVKYSESGTDGSGDAYAFRDSDTRARLAWGVGASWRFTDQLSARIDWDRYEGVGRRFALDAHGHGKFDVDTLTASLVFAF